MDILKYSEENINNLVVDLTKLVSFASVLDKESTDPSAPFGKENKECLEYFLKMAESDGFKVGNVDNVAGFVELECGIEGAQTLGILAHLDVVPAPLDGWNTPPFTATVIGDKVYGRGTTDDKGPLLSAYYALKAIKEEGCKLTKNIRIIVGTDEESGSRCLHRYLEKQGEPEIGFSPDADFPVIYGEKGIASFDFVSEMRDPYLVSLTSGDVYNVVPDKAILKSRRNLDCQFNEYLEKKGFSGKAYRENNIFVYELYGKRAHAMNPTKGVNALVNMCLFAKEYFEDKMIWFVSENLSEPFAKGLDADCYDSEMKHLTMNVANFRLNGSEERVGINIRYPSVESYETFKENATMEADNYNIKVETLGNSAPHVVPLNSNLVQSLLASYREVTKDYESQPITIGGGTYARDLKNAVAFGLLMPGEEDVMHQANEYVKISVLRQGIMIYYGAIKRLACE